MRRLAGIGLALLLAACGASELEGTPSGSASTPSSTASRVPAWLVEPTEEERVDYCAIAAVLLENTPYGIETLGERRFIALFGRGVFEACRALDAGANLFGAISAAFGEVPDDAPNPRVEKSGKMLASVLLLRGVDTFCPSLYSGYDISDVEAAFEEFSQ